MTMQHCPTVYIPIFQKHQTLRQLDRIGIIIFTNEEKWVFELEVQFVSNMIKICYEYIYKI